jgi:hypothetical protein
MPATSGWLVPARAPLCVLICMATEPGVSAHCVQPVLPHTCTSPQTSPFLVTSQALEGRFLLNGAEVPLPVRDHDSLAHKVEALRMYLEHKLGTDPFLK